MFISASGFASSWKQFSSFLVTLKSPASLGRLALQLCPWYSLCCFVFEIPAVIERLTGKESELTEATVALGEMLDRVEFYKWLVHSFFWCVCIRMILLPWATWQVMNQQWIILRPQALFCPVLHFYICVAGYSHLLHWCITPSNLSSMQQLDLSEI